MRDPNTRSTKGNDFGNFENGKRSMVSGHWSVFDFKCCIAHCILTTEHFSSDPCRFCVPFPLSGIVRK
jgi:hypothetical protein